MTDKELADAHKYDRSRKSEWMPELQGHYCDCCDGMEDGNLCPECFEDLVDNGTFRSAMHSDLERPAEEYEECRSYEEILKLAEELDD